ncbi:hypothetical protein I7I53_07080 [Histoplasma capsulatum var. duboisii H88]|uniref:Uncharacterized protein n=2 Tax=Ajellomyces capsulatus TaxID=5037 RepID=A0A8H7Z8E1_AJECA|nr:hypothetical protein I7I52_02281 [Histoplasma capsulatum]QSS51700.1 hypothetical protein I7I53_07080 [Histoplasma capsulatum var. duboisii H88]QSS69671.1 hypothetical protein I7I50_11042 [Histoplasma capsulatum G186AR]
MMASFMQCMAQQKQQFIVPLHQIFQQNLVLGILVFPSRQCPLSLYPHNFLIPIIVMNPRFFRLVILESLRSVVRNLQNVT